MRTKRSNKLILRKCCTIVVVLWLWCHLILWITFRHEVYQWVWVCFQCHSLNNTVQDNWLHACHWKSHLITTWTTYKHIFVIINVIQTVRLSLCNSWFCACFDRWRSPKWTWTAQELTRFVFFRLILDSLILKSETSNQT